MIVTFTLGPQANNLYLAGSTTRVNLGISPSGNAVVVGIVGKKDLWVADLSFGDGSSAPTLSQNTEYTTGQDPYVAFFSNNNFVEIHGGDSFSGNKTYNVPGQLSSGNLSMGDSHIVEMTNGGNLKGEDPTLAVGVPDASGFALNWYLRRDANAGVNSIYPVRCEFNGSGLDYYGITDYTVGSAPYHDNAMTADNYIHVLLIDPDENTTTYVNGPTTSTSVQTDSSTNHSIGAGQASITVTKVNGYEVIVVVSVVNGTAQVTFGTYEGQGKVSWQAPVPTGINLSTVSTVSVRNKADGQVGLVLCTSSGFSALLLNLKG